MYDENFNEIMEFIYGIEKKIYTNDKDDKPTNFGIIQDTYDGWNKKHHKPLKDVKYISEKEATEIYYNEFWVGSGASKIKDLRQAYYLFDMSINSGVPEALKLFKKCNGDMSDFIEKRKKYYNKVIEVHPEKEKYREGWMNRLDALEKSADELIKKHNQKQQKDKTRPAEQKEHAQENKQQAKPKRYDIQSEYVKTKKTLILYLLTILQRKYKI